MIPNQQHLHHFVAFDTFRAGGSGVILKAEVEREVKIRIAIILTVCYGVYLLGQSLEAENARSIASEKSQKEQTVANFQIRKD